MMQVFEFLTQALSGSIVLALFAAFSWGVISTLFSPCQLTSIPLIVGFVSGQGKTTTKRAFLISLSFSLGLTVIIAIVGFITAMTGRMLGDIGLWTNYLVGLVLVLIGLSFLGVIRMPNWGIGQPVYKRKGIFSAFVLGLIFGLAMGPCTFAFLAPILAVAFMTGAKNVILGSFLILFYVIGHCFIIVLAGTFIELLQRYLSWNSEHSKLMVAIKMLCGVLIIFAGISLLI